MPLIEIEVKFYIKKYEEIIKKIIDYAGKSVKEGFEKNILFDSKNSILKNQYKILRLRSYMGQNIITYKEPAQKKSQEFKILNEIETNFDSFHDLRAILKGIGFSNEQIYEKERKIFVKKDPMKKDLLICIDSLPFGHFIELEGDEASIKEAAKSLGLNWQDKILPSYRTIFEKIKNDHDLSFTNITFENFKPYNIIMFESSIKSL